MLYPTELRARLPHSTNRFPLHAAARVRVNSMMRRALAILVAGCSLAAAQDSTSQDSTAMRDALEWTVALRGRFAQMSNRVVRVHATAGIAALVCRESPADAWCVCGAFRGRP